MSLEKLGGFQSGFHARLTSQAEARFPDYLVCTHDCSTVVQLVSRVSGEVELELCTIEARNLAWVLLEAANSSSPS